MSMKTVIGILYCKELNIYRIRNLQTGSEIARTEEDLLFKGIDAAFLRDCRENPGIEKII